MELDGKIRFNAQEKHPTTDEIAALEQEIGYKIPASLISAFSGSVIEIPSSNSFPITTDDSEGITDFIEWDDLARSYASIKEYDEFLLDANIAPMPLLPFANCEGGNYITIHLENNHIYFVHHETGEGQEIARSLDELISKVELYDYSKDEFSNDATFSVAITDELKKMLEEQKKKT